MPDRMILKPVDVRCTNSVIWDGRKKRSVQVSIRAELPRAWPKGWDLNPRNACAFTGFRDRLLKPLGHPSGYVIFFPYN